ncbi:hypothetical protein HELRODRAFT_134485, partial [Helobdella robusta]|uniref:ubiquitinyl hydrolase 1 n=1 Tax=Helobdella robusta TaxID=6412 RepID=T1EI49_HELRO
GIVGIQNHGNTCFMNAVIQCLSNTEPLLSYFLCEQYKEDIKRANKYNAKRFGTKGELTESLAVLLKSLWMNQLVYTADKSTDFKAIVSKYGSQYRGNFQHDVQEFLIWLLDKVHEDLNIATKKKYRANKQQYISIYKNTHTTKQSSIGRCDDDVAAEAMANHSRCNNSFIHDLFQAMYRSSLTCPSCSQQSNTFDPFLSVSLPIPR